MYNGKLNNCYYFQAYCYINTYAKCNKNANRNERIRIIKIKLKIL